MGYAFRKGDISCTTDLYTGSVGCLLEPYMIPSKEVPAGFSKMYTFMYLYDRTRHALMEFFNSHLIVKGFHLCLVSWVNTAYLHRRSTCVILLSLLLSRGLGRVRSEVSHFKT